VLRAVCALSVAFTGVDAASYLFDENEKPSSKDACATSDSGYPSVLVLLSSSLSTDVSKLSAKTLVPEMFSVLNVPAAKLHHEAGFQRMRYMLTVASVCGLSGAVLSSFLPGSRIVNALSTGFVCIRFASSPEAPKVHLSDRLLPLPADISRRPVMSVFIFFILVSFGLLINGNVLLHVVLLTTPLKMVATVCLVFLQHYRAEPVGNSSRDQAIRKKRQQVSLAGDGESIVTSALNDEEDDIDDIDSDTSFDTSVFVHMAVAKREAQRLQRRLEKKQEKYLSETSPVLVKSVSHYNSMEPVKKCPENHNCIADSCSARVSEG
ncbi:hypothetical protein OSTOST_11737, partial [Ostertagia ostertagi]